MIRGTDVKGRLRVITATDEEPDWAVSLARQCVASEKTEAVQFLQSVTRGVQITSGCPMNGHTWMAVVSEDLNLKPNRYVERIYDSSVADVPLRAGDAEVVEAVAASLAEDAAPESDDLELPSYAASDST